MEVKAYNIGVSISFPPDTNTPQLQAELKQRDAIQKELASYGTSVIFFIIRFIGAGEGMGLITHY